MGTKRCEHEEYGVLGTVLMESGFVVENMGMKRCRFVADEGEKYCPRHQAEELEKMRRDAEKIERRKRRASEVSK